MSSSAHLDLSQINFYFLHWCGFRLFIVQNTQFFRKNFLIHWQLNKKCRRVICNWILYSGDLMILQCKLLSFTKATNYKIKLKSKKRNNSARGKLSQKLLLFEVLFFFLLCLLCSVFCNFLLHTQSYWTVHLLVFSLFWIKQKCGDCRFNIFYSWHIC